MHLLLGISLMVIFIFTHESLYIRIYRWLAGVQRSRWDVSGRRDTRDESDESLKAAPDARISGVTVSQSHDSYPIEQSR